MCERNVLMPFLQMSISLLHHISFWINSHQLSRETVWRPGWLQVSAPLQLNGRAWSTLAEEWRLEQTDRCFPLISAHKKAVRVTKYMHIISHCLCKIVFSVCTWCEVHLLCLKAPSFERVVLRRSPPSGFPQASVWRSVPEGVHYRRLETFGTVDRPEMIQLTAPWTAPLGPPVRPNIDSRYTVCTEPLQALMFLSQKL